MTMIRRQKAWDEWEAEWDSRKNERIKSWSCYTKKEKYLEDKDM